jgi:hypothetical protein
VVNLQAPCKALGWRARAARSFCNAGPTFHEVVCQQAEGSGRSRASTCHTVGPWPRSAAAIGSCPRGRVSPRPATSDRGWLPRRTHHRVRPTAPRNHPYYFARHSANHEGDARGHETSDLQAVQTDPYPRRATPLQFPNSAWHRGGTVPALCRKCDGG